MRSRAQIQHHMPNIKIATKAPLFLQWFLAIILLCGSKGLLEAQTIAEKKANLSHTGGDLSPEAEKFLYQVNRQLEQKQLELREFYRQAQALFQKNAPACAYEDLLKSINKVKESINQLENEWREMAISSSGGEAYALMHQPDTTLEQLVIDYGSHDFVYLIPPEIASIPFSVDSNLPIPRAAWNQMLELILKANGVGYEQLNPFLRRLFIMSEKKLGLQVITNRRQDLSAFPSNARVAFVLTPEPTDSRRISFFLNNFVDPDRTVVQLAGRDIILIGDVGEVQELLKLYDFVSTNRGDREYKAVGLSKVPANEMARVLQAIFGGGGDDDFEEIPPPPMPNQGGKPGPLPRPPMPRFERVSNDSETNGLRVITLEEIAQAIFLIGTREEIRKAEQIIADVEEQVGEARERTIFWYMTKHSDPEDLAEVLSRVYYLMVSTGTGSDGPIPLPGNSQSNAEADARISIAPPPIIPLPPPQRQYIDGFYQEGNFPINPTPVEPPIAGPLRPRSNRPNFIVDYKTGAIVMVVEVDLLAKLKELIKRLDVPKKMVQLDVLLFEKRLAKKNNFGLNLLRIGSCATNTNRGCFSFFDFIDPETRNPIGLGTFLFSQKKHGNVPAYDFIYNFLLTQDDVTINSAPSVVTVNQTPAYIAIQDEISINTGIFEVATTGGATLKDSFVRSQYGITMKIVPTIHQISEDDEDYNDDVDMITLDSDIVFDTIQPGDDPTRPDVTRRKIKNETRVPDGQAVILGGLRRKVTDDAREAIPFIGEIPGIGKLFSSTFLTENSTEMFIFITPKIINDPVEDLYRIRMEELCKRPGDIPEYLCHLYAAREYEKNRLFEGWMTMLFGPCPERCIDTEGEYDGR